MTSKEKAMKKEWNFTETKRRIEEKVKRKIRNIKETYEKM